MRIELVPVAIGVGAGVVDELAERNDAEKGRVETAKKWTTYFRFGGLALGYAGQAMNVMPDYAAALAQSLLPLATKTAMGVVMKPKVSSSVGSGNRFAGMRAPVASGPIGRNYEPGFNPASLT